MNKYLIILFLFISCSSNVDYDSYLNKIGIKLNQKYSILENTENIASGDLSVNFKLKLGQRDFENVRKKIIETQGFQKYAKNDFPNNKANFEIKKIVAYKRGEIYYYEISSRNKIENYSISLNEKKELELNYIED